MHVRWACNEQNTRKQPRGEKKGAFLASAALFAVELVTLDREQL